MSSRTLQVATGEIITAPAPKSTEAVVDWRAYRMALLVKCYLFFESCTHNGLTHLVNVYLVALEGWTPLEASWIWFTRDAMNFFFEGAVGHIVDKTEYKKFLLGVVGVLKIVAGIIMVSTTNVGAQIVKGAIDGLINLLVTPATTALTLGAVGKTKFHRKRAQLNIMVIKSLLSCIIDFEKAILPAMILFNCSLLYINLFELLPTSRSRISASP